MLHWQPLGRVVLASVFLIGQPAAGQGSSAEQPATEQPATEPAQPQLPSAESLFERHIEAIGGKDVVFGITSRRMVGRLEVFATGNDTPLQKAIIRLTSEAPNKVIQEIIIPGQSTSVRYFDGKAGWIDGGDGRIIPMEGEALERFTVASRFYAEADYENHFKSIETMERQVSDEDEVYIVRVTHFSGRSEAFIFSDESGLLIGVIGQRKGSDGQPIEFRRQYTQYNDTGGMLFPAKVIEMAGGQIFDIEFNKVELGIEFPEMARPANIPDADISGFQK